MTAAQRAMDHGRPAQIFLVESRNGMQTTRRGMGRVKRGASLPEAPRRTMARRLRPDLPPAVEQHLPLERAHPIDEEDAVEVIDLVLDCTGEEARRLDSAWATIAV